MVRIRANQYPKSENGMRDLQYQIDVMTAFRDGKRVECVSLFNSDDDWARVREGHQFDWSSLDYRIAPEPRKAREWWMSENGSLRRVFSTLQAAKGEFPREDFICVREVLPE
jgi:hypothetical protein